VTSSDRAPLAAVVQLRSTADRARNRDEAVSWVRAAALGGARLVALPEMWPFIGPDPEKVEGAETIDGETVSAMRGLARELGIVLVGGSFAERAELEGHVHNTAFVAGPDGALLAVYRKVHLFDVDIPGGAQFRESATVAPGDRLVVVDTAFGRLGLAVCYDLRFPPLWDSLRAAGAEMVAIPSAFTAHTGKDHWEVLLRARAIEQQMYVLAPDQAGWHDARRQSHGHSMIVDPWGLVVARASEGPGFALAPIELSRVATVRQQLPCRSHRRTPRDPAA
jgi:predicted amidohydrolase